MSGIDRAWNQLEINVPTQVLTGCLLLLFKVVREWCALCTTWLPAVFPCLWHHRHSLDRLPALIQCQRHIWRALSTVRMDSAWAGPMDMEILSVLKSPASLDTICSWITLCCLPKRCTEKGLYAKMVVHRKSCHHWKLSPEQSCTQFEMRVKNSCQQSRLTLISKL
jgi:hypothetical protein